MLWHMRVSTYAGLVLLGGVCGIGCAADADPGGSGGSSGSSGEAGFCGGFFGGSGGTGAGTSGGSAGTTSGGTGAGGSGGGASGSGGTGGGGTGGGGTGGGTCSDPGPEPNDTIPKATPVCSSVPCEIGCSDTPLGNLSGVAAPGDVDLFTYFGKDTISCSVNPYAKTDDAGFRLCMWAQCADGKATTIKKCGNGTATDGPGGLKGCCAQAPIEMEIEHDCPGITDNDSGAIYMQVDQATACVSYSIDYHF